MGPYITRTHFVCNTIGLLVFFHLLHTKHYNENKLFYVQVSMQLFSLLIFRMQMATKNIRVHKVVGVHCSL